jgi:hypothetical protein
MSMPDKSEPRFNVDFPIRVFGVDDDDRAFSQIVHARNIGGHGAKLAGLEEHLKAGDIIGVHFGDKGPLQRDMGGGRRGDTGN